MQRSLFSESCLIVQFLFFLIICGCSGSSYDPSEKAAEISREEASQDIYNVLSDYPALKACFTTGTLSRKTFEEKLFKDLLGNSKDADMLVAMLDGLPPLFESRSVPEDIFDPTVEAEMNQKGPLPDLFSALAGLPNYILNLSENEKQALYTYFDLPEDDGTTETSTYVREILYDISHYLTTCDQADVNTVMDLIIDDLSTRQSSQNQVLDFADIDTELLEITTQSPDGLAEMLHGSRDLMAQREIQTSLIETLRGIGQLCADTSLYPKTRTMLTNLNAAYTKASLGEILERVWTKGAVPGASVKAMAIEGYGKYGKIACNLRELLTQPAILNAFVETIASFDREGYHFDDVDGQVRAYVQRDPFLQARDGAGEFGNSSFYAPTAQFSYKNYTGLQGFIDYSTRWGVPLTLTANCMFENHPSGPATQALIRTLIPTADSIPIAAMIWTEVYEKGAGFTYGHGQPVTTQQGYGMMKDGIFVAPIAPDTVTGASMALTQVGDALLNGPYDNIYDNLRWLLHERTFYMTIDLVQFTKRIPLLDIPFRAYFLSHGISSLPVVLFKIQGITTMMYMDLGTLLDAVFTQLNLTNLPDGLKALAVNVLSQLAGSSSPGTDKMFLLPQDMRDLWTMVISLSYYDPAAFHPDRFLDVDNNTNYSLYYDITNYTYAANADKINPIFPLIGALSLGSYIQYRAVVDQFPPSLDYLEARKAAAKAAFGGVEVPIQYVINLIAPLTEQPMEASAYSQSDQRTTLLKLLTPMLDTASTGTIDAIFKLVCTLGQPELSETRMRLLNGLAAVVATTDQDTSDGPYALAAEMLSTPSKATSDPRHWEALRWKIDTAATLLSEEYHVVENLTGLLSNVDQEDLSTSEKTSLASGLTGVLGRCAEDHFFSRCLIDLSDIMKHLNSTHTWTDMAGVMQDSLKDEGLIDYLLNGLEKAARYTWDQVLSDVDRFLHSDLIMSFTDGSFWNAIKSLINFMVDAID